MNSSYLSEEQSELECRDENIAAIIEKILKERSDKLLKNELRKIKQAQEDFNIILHNQTILFAEKIEKLELMLQYLFERQRADDEEEKMRYLLHLD